MRLQSADRRIIDHEARHHQCRYDQMHHDAGVGSDIRQIRYQRGKADHDDRENHKFRGRRRKPQEVDIPVGDFRSVFRFPQKDDSGEQRNHCGEQRSVKGHKAHAVEQIVVEDKYGIQYGSDAAEDNDKTDNRIHDFLDAVAAGEPLFKCVEIHSADLYMFYVFEMVMCHKQLKLYNDSCMEQRAWKQNPKNKPLYM